MLVGPGSYHGKLIFLFGDTDLPHQVLYCPALPVVIHQTGTKIVFDQRIQSLDRGQCSEAIFIIAESSSTPAPKTKSSSFDAVIVMFYI